MKIALRASCFTMASVLALAGTGVATAQDVPPQPIPQNPDDYDAARKYAGQPAEPRPVRSFEVPQHPFMAPNGDNNIHNDAYMTDAYDRAGPLGRDMEVTSTYQQGDCASVTFDAEGRIVTICVGVEGPRLTMIDPETLATKTALTLPPRSGGGTGSSPFNDFSGGGYFYLDHRYRAVIPTNNRQIWVVRTTETPSGPAFEVVRTYNLATEVLPGDALVSALPDWKGLVWFVSVRGVVGAINPRSGRVRTVRLEDEVIANSFAVDRGGGVYVASDHALYRFDARRRGKLRTTWRKRYNRGTRTKPGQASQGSGTTPTIVGRRYVAITDNADPRMHVLVYRRARRVRPRNRLVCKQGVFRRRRGATDQSLISVGRSLIVENNYGYSGPTSTSEGASTARGLWRVAFGRRGCRVVWRNRQRAPSVVPKASLETGLVYTYTKPRRKDDLDAWYLTAIDYRTGRTVFRQLAGTGLGYNNNYAPVTIGPNGTAYVGALGGLIKLEDG